MPENAPATVPVSVVVPTYNRRELLVRTLDSLDALQPSPAEVIVVSDGSNDGTDEVVRARGLTLLHTERQGAAGARNRGWRASKQDVVAFVDDDCVVDPGWVAALLAAFDDPGVGLVQGRTMPDGAGGRYARSLDVRPELSLYESCNIAYRRCVLDAVGGFDEAFVQRIQPRVGMPGRRGGRPFGEDTHLGWRVRRAGWSEAYAETAVVRHFVFPGSWVDMLREAWRMGNFTLLVGEIPELRDLLPGGRYFLRPHSALSQGALVGLVAAVTGHRKLGALAVAPYVAWLLRSRRGRDLIDQAAKDAVCSASLLVGSLRTGRVIL